MFYPRTSGQYWKGRHLVLGGRIQLTDAISGLLRDKAIDAVRLVGESFNCGEKMGYLRGVCQLRATPPCAGEAFRKWLAEFVA